MYQILESTWFKMLKENRERMHHSLKWSFSSAFGILEKNLLADENENCQRENFSKYPFQSRILHSLAKKNHVTKFFTISSSKMNQHTAAVRYFILTLKSQSSILNALHATRRKLWYFLPISWLKRNSKRNKKQTSDTLCVV